MTKITKPSLSSIIYKELKKHNDVDQSQEGKQVNYEYGTVISVKDGVVQAYGLLNVQAGELVEFVDSDVKCKYVVHFIMDYICIHVNYYDVVVVY